MSSDIFLKLDGIKGESKDEKHKGSIAIESFQWGLQQAGTMGHGGGGGAGKVSFSDISIQKFADSSTPALMQACAGGDHIKTGVLTVRKAGGKQEEYYKISLTQILVSSIQNTGANGHGGVPSETVSLNFDEIKFDYKEQSGDGKLGGVVKFGWNLSKNVKV